MHDNRLYILDVVATSFAKLALFVGDISLAAIIIISVRHDSSSCYYFV